MGFLDPDNHIMPALQNSLLFQILLSTIILIPELYLYDKATTEEVFLMKFSKFKRAAISWLLLILVNPTKSLLA